jgi:transcriptional regulator with XRE-family HTH domain
VYWCDDIILNQDQLMKRFGEKLRALRERRSLTVRQLASMLGINSHSHIVGLEAGKHKPSADLILKIADLFEVSTDQLMRDELEVD